MKTKLKAKLETKFRNKTRENSDDLGLGIACYEATTRLVFIKRLGLVYLYSFCLVTRITFYSLG